MTVSTTRARHRAARQAVLVAAGVILGFALFGQQLLSYMHISLPALQASGGLLLLLVAMELPTFNRTVLDRAIAKTLRRADGTRPVVPHSGVWPHLPQLDGTDTHVYFGWYHGDERDLPRFLGAIPRMARFVTEFGAQSVPDTADFLEPERWPDLDWERITERHKIQKTIFDKRVPPADFATFEGWREATQQYQARPFAWDDAPLIFAVHDGDATPAFVFTNQGNKLVLGDRKYADVQNVVVISDEAEVLAAYTLVGFNPKTTGADGRIDYRFEEDDRFGTLVEFGEL